MLQLIMSVSLVCGFTAVHSAISKLTLLQGREKTGEQYKSQANLQMTT